jgi:hypothetical protein
MGRVEIVAHRERLSPEGPTVESAASLGVVWGILLP